MEPHNKPFSVAEMLGAPRHVTPVEGFEVDYYRDDAIVVYHAYGTQRETVDAFVTVGSAYLDSCIAAGRPALWLYRVGAISLTPYSRQKIDAFVADYTTIVGRGAYIFAPSPFLYLMRNFVMVYNRRSWPSVTFQTYRAVDPALEWLYEGWQAWKQGAT